MIAPARQVSAPATPFEDCEATTPWIECSAARSQLAETPLCAHARHCVTAVTQRARARQSAVSLTAQRLCRIHGTSIVLPGRDNQLQHMLTVLQSSEKSMRVPCPVPWPLTVEEEQIHTLV